MQTKYINPHGDKPACQGPNKGYFTEDPLLDRVPSVFLVLAGCYVAMQLLGCALIRNPSGFVHARVGKKLAGDDEEGRVPLVDAPGAPAKIQRPPRQAAQTADFWLIWAMFGLNGLATVFFSSLWKAMGENYLPSVPDASWAAAGSVASLFNASGRIVWGGIADTVGVKKSIVAHCTLSCILFFTLYLIRDAGYPVFFTWICALFFCIGGNFSLFPTATAHAFGKESFGANYGCIFTSQAVAGVVGGLLSSDLVRRAVVPHHATNGTTAAPAGPHGFGVPPSAAPCPKGAEHRDDYLPALMTVGACTALAMVLSVVFLFRGGSTMLPFEPLAARRLAKPAGRVN